MVAFLPRARLAAAEDHAQLLQPPLVGLEVCQPLSLQAGDVMLGEVPSVSGAGCAEHRVLVHHLGGGGEVVGAIWSKSYLGGERRGCLWLCRLFHSLTGVIVCGTK